jgi:predicted dehydrogenase
MIDLGAHPMYLLCALLGEPVSVKSTFTQMSGRGVEDNAVSLLEFENGAIGVSETGFVSNSDPYTVEISGDKGYARYDDKNLTYHYDGLKNWVTTNEFEKNPPEPLEYFLDCLKNGEKPTLYTLDEAIVLSEIMDAAYRSYQSGKKEKV